MDRLAAAAATPRVYTIVALLVAALAGPAAAQPGLQLTIEPSMARGRAEAAVTIVEFSDYQ